MRPYKNGMFLKREYLQNLSRHHVPFSNTHSSTTSFLKDLTVWDCNDMLHYRHGPTAYVVWGSHACISNRSSLNAENWCNNTLQHKHGVSITLTCWFEEINTIDFDHPLRSAICYFSYGRRFNSVTFLYSKGMWSQPYKDTQNLITIQ